MERQDAILDWWFPLPRTHTGVVLGNGVQGLMVWGIDRLCITVGRAGFWDRRGGTTPILGITFGELRSLLEAGDEPAILAAFAGPSGDGPQHSLQIGCGRIELALPGGLRPRSAALHLSEARLVVQFAAADGRTAALEIGQAPTEELFWVKADGGLSGLRPLAVPTWRFVGDELARLGFEPPTEWTDSPDTSGGFVQPTPADEALALAWHRTETAIFVTTALGATGREAREAARERAGRAAEPGRLANAELTRTEWWSAYWRDVPDVSLPDPVLQRAWDYGLSKQAGLTPPQGIAATLQGPWMEEYQLPPWSNDHHFNINLEMIYGAALPTNRLSHFEPLWAMIERWLPTLGSYGESFFGRKGALMLPHAVDDRGKVVGQFWTGTIDHACTAWMALLAWQHYRWSMDASLLTRIVLPLLTGAFEGYWAMLEQVHDPETGSARLSLPVSVSPEYRASEMDAWGRDASFQLAALHAVVRALRGAAAVLGMEADPRWDRVEREVPPYTTFPGPIEWDEEKHRTAMPPGERDAVPRIALWHGQDLEESHRHHSHLASVYPFASIDPLSQEHRLIVANSLRHWTRLGAGLWTGWCVPWASILCSRCNLADAAVAWLHWWNDVFVNEGGGTLHNADFAGAARLDEGGLAVLAGEQACRAHELMQMDAAMGAVTAIAELLVQVRGDEVHVLPAIPRRWRRLSFAGIRVDGAFLVGARVENGERQSVSVRSEVGGTIRLVHGFEAWKLQRLGVDAGMPAHGAFSAGKGPRLDLTLEPGETVEIARSNG
ncbi:MAG: glycosyl hydrolase family 95 catalytic domain-containing protein [Spirochaetota bacterium]